MKRKESKIPLLLTMIVLGYFVFWAIGYVGRNRPHEAPVTDMQRPAVVTEVREQQPPQVQPVVAQPATPVANVQVSKTPALQGPPPANVSDNSEEVVLSGRTQNRKLAGLLEDSTAKH